MKTFIAFIFIFLAIFIFALVNLNNHYVEKSKKESDEIQKFVEECIVKSDRRIEEVGSIWTKHFLVCNPK